MVKQFAWERKKNIQNSVENIHIKIFGMNVNLKKIDGDQVSKFVLDITEVDYFFCVTQSLACVRQSQYLYIIIGLGIFR